MGKTNVATKTKKVYTHEGATAQSVSPLAELRRSVMTCLLWENTFYEKGNDLADRIANLVAKVDSKKVAEIAIEARERMYLRHVPLFLVRELARKKGNGKLVSETLARVIQRADELGEFVSLFFKDGRKPCLTRGIRKGLAQAFTKFDAYQLAKYNRDEQVKLRDVLFLCHAKPKDADQAALWKQLVDKALQPPDTWEVALSAGKDKKETWERLLKEKRLGGLAVLRNLRNMTAAKVEENLIRERLTQGISRALPFRFVTAARYNPALEDMIETAMFKAAEKLNQFLGRTGLLIDVSGSMDDKLSSKSETTRIDAAAGLAILLREKSQTVKVATFSSDVVVVPPRRGFALRDAINNSQVHSATYLQKALSKLVLSGWNDSQLDRLIVITDEQAHDGILKAPVACSYVVNVASYQHGVSYGNGWAHIDGWSERILDYITEAESETDSQEAN